MHLGLLQLAGDLIRFKIKISSHNSTMRIYIYLLHGLQDALPLAKYGVHLSVSSTKYFVAPLPSYSGILCGRSLGVWIITISLVILLVYLLPLNRRYFGSQAPLTKRLAITLTKIYLTIRNLRENNEQRK